MNMEVTTHYDELCPDLGVWTVVAECEECERINAALCSGKEFRICRTLARPSRQHSRIGGCAFRTHNKAEEEAESKKLNPLKASKRSKRTKK